MAYKKGTYKVVCARTGAVVNASDCRLEWTGALVLKSQWESRNPLDRPASLRDRQAPPIARPEGAMQFIDATDVSADTL